MDQKEENAFHKNRKRKPNELKSDKKGIKKIRQTYPAAVPVYNGSGDEQVIPESMTVASAVITNGSALLSTSQDASSSQDQQVSTEGTTVATEVGRGGPVSKMTSLDESKLQV